MWEQRLQPFTKIFGNFFAGFQERCIVAIIFSHRFHVLFPIFNIVSNSSICNAEGRFYLFYKQNFGTSYAKPYQILTPFGTVVKFPIYKLALTEFSYI